MHAQLMNLGRSQLWITSMEMNQIRYFLAVCEHRNFTHAASASNVSQPSLTTAIKKLEDELGGDLFIRDRAGCRLTTLGKSGATKVGEGETPKQMRPKQKRFGTPDWREFQFVSVSARQSGRVKISAAMERIRKKVPQAEIELIVESKDILLAELREGKFDLVVTADKVSDELYRIDDLYSEAYAVVVSDTHPFAQMGAVFPR